MQFLCDHKLASSFLMMFRGSVDAKMGAMNLLTEILLANSNSVSTNGVAHPDPLGWQQWVQQEQVTSEFLPQSA